jgi:hypothetical protein
MILEFKEALNRTTNSIAHTRDGIVVLCKAKLVGKHNVMFTGYSKKCNEKTGMPSTLFARQVTDQHQAFASKKGFIAVGRTPAAKALVIDLHNVTHLVNIGAMVNVAYVADHTATEVQPTVGGIIYTVTDQYREYHKCVGVDNIDMLLPWAASSKQYAKQIAEMKPVLGDIYVDRATGNVKVSVIGIGSENPFGFKGQTEAGLLLDCDLFTYVKGN